MAIPDANFKERLSEELKTAQEIRQACDKLVESIHEPYRFVKEPPKYGIPATTEAIDADYIPKRNSAAAELVALIEKTEWANGG